jgi:putative transposase
MTAAIRCRRPGGSALRPQTITANDEGGQHVCLGFGRTARDAGIAGSTGSTGDCRDDALAESFLPTLKKELVHRRSWPTRRELASESFEYTEAFHNRVRRHSTLGILAPLSARKALSCLTVAASPLRGSGRPRINCQQDAKSAPVLGFENCST